MDYKNYYQILGVDKNASKEEIQAAFRKLARKHHPDVNPDDPAAEEKFKEINEAYQVLSDPEKRQKYDRFGRHWKQHQQAGGRAEDFNWSEWASRPTGGQHTGYTTQRVSPEEFEELFGQGLGGFSDFFETLFGGVGVSGGSRSGPAWGSRRTGTSRRSPFGRSQPQSRSRKAGDLETRVQITLEEAFHGTSRVLEKTGGRRIEVKIPPGVKTGSRVRLSGQGESGMGFGQAGDLYLEVEVLPHENFEREGPDLKTTLPVDLYTLLLGGNVEVSTPEKTVRLDIPPETDNHTKFRLKGLGMPKLRAKNQRGDLYVEVVAQLPDNLTDREKSLFKELQKLRNSR